VIYFVQIPNGLIKIGATTDLKGRLPELASDYGTAIALVATMPGDLVTKLEIHKQFSHLQVGRTDHFEPGPDLLDFISEL
jgi:hypothetical protein